MGSYVIRLAESGNYLNTQLDGYSVPQWVAMAAAETFGSRELAKSKVLHVRGKWPALFTGSDMRVGEYIPPRSAEFCEVERIPPMISAEARAKLIEATRAYLRDLAGLHVSTIRARELVDALESAHLELSALQVEW